MSKAVDALLVALAALLTAFYIYGLWDQPFIALSFNNILFPALMSPLLTYGFRSFFGAIFFLLALGLSIWCIGEIVWAIHVLVFGIEVPLPSLADVFHITGYGTFFISFFIFMKVFQYVFSERAIKVPSIISGLVILAITSFTVVPEALAHSGNLVEAALAVAYPIHDAILIALAVIALMVFWGGKLARGWLYLLGRIHAHPA